jgi:hypothetical protein
MNHRATDLRMMGEEDSLLELVVCPVGGPAGAAQRYLMSQPFAVVGRNAAADLPLADRQVGGRHVYLQRFGGEIFFVDLSKRTGIRQGGRLRHSGWLAPGEGIQVGPFLLSTPEDLAYPAPPPCQDPLRPSSLEPSGAVGWEIEIGEGPHKRFLWRLDRVLTLVGRSPRCKLRPRYDSVSEFHCCIVATAAGLWVVDLLSRAGTLVNDRRARWARLGDGDRLRLGDFDMRLWPRPADACPRRGSFPPVESRPLPPAEVARVAGQALRPAVALPPVTIRQTLAEQFQHRGDLLEAFLLSFAGQIDLVQHTMHEQFQQAMAALLQRFDSQQEGQMAAIREELEKVRQLTQELQALQAEAARHGAGPPPPPAPGPTPTLPEPAAPNGHHATPPPDGTHAELWQRMTELEQQRQGRWQKILDFLKGK